VDAHRLLTDILPHSLASMFIHTGDQTLPKYFSLTPPTEIAAPSSTTWIPRTANA
jgi:hypothetical protein